MIGLMVGTILLMMFALVVKDRLNSMLFVFAVVFSCAVVVLWAYKAVVNNDFLLVIPMVFWMIIATINAISAIICWGQRW